MSHHSVTYCGFGKGPVGYLQTNGKLPIAQKASLFVDFCVAERSNHSLAGVCILFSLGGRHFVVVVVVVVVVGTLVLVRFLRPLLGGLEPELV